MRVKIKNMEKEEECNLATNDIKNIKVKRPVKLVKSYPNRYEEMKPNRNRSWLSSKADNVKKKGNIIPDVMKTI